MTADKNMYLNKAIQLYPGDTHSKFGIITGFDEFGFIVKITKASPNCKYEVGKEYFFSHSCGFNFKFM